MNLLIRRRGRSTRIGNRWGYAPPLSMRSDALGDEIFRRGPSRLDTILSALEAGKPVQEPLTAHI